MFCRFCGASIQQDSVFCAKCGKRLGSDNPRLEKISRILHLRTPYPYAIFLLLLVTIWALSPHAPKVDYSHIKWTLQPNRKLDLPEENLYQQGFSLVLENTGTEAVREVPIDFGARIEPTQPAEIGATFLGNRFLIMEAGKPLPLTVILSGEVQPGSKRSYLVEGSIQAKPPFKVVYEVRAEASEAVLTNFVVER